MIPNRQMRRHPEMFGITLYAPEGDEGAGGGGSGTAVLDKPADGLVADDTATGAEGDAKEDSDVAGETKTGEGEKAKTPVLDEDGEKVAAARVAEALEAHKREQATLKEQQDAEDAETAHQDALRNHYTTHETKLTEALNAINVKVTEDMVGDTLRLDQAMSDKLLGVLKAYDADAAKAIGLRLRETLTNQVLATTPEADRAATKKALDAAESKDFAKAIGEAYAPRAAALQELDLDGVLGLSAKAKRGYAEAIKVAKDEAKKAERARIYDLHGITLDEPSLDGMPAGGSNELTYAQFLKLKEPEKAKWKAANPEKFDAFLGITKGK